MYIVYELNNWPHDPANNFTLENCLIDTVKLTRNVDKIKFTYNGPGIGFDVKGMWSYGNGFARFVVLFGVDNTSSSHIHNRKQ